MKPPKPISLAGKGTDGEDVSPSVPVPTPARTPKPIGLPQTAPAKADQSPSPVETPSRQPKPIALPSTTQPTVPAISPVNAAPRPIGLPQTGPAPSRTNGGRAIGLARDNHIHDALVQAAIVEDPTMHSFVNRIKPRFATLSKIDCDDVLNWGERNVIGLGLVTTEKNTLAKRLNQLDTSTWLTKAMEAASKPPSKMSRFFGSSETPQFYKTKLTQIREELLDIRRTLKKLHEEVQPDAEDLRMDIVSLSVFAKANPGKLDEIVVQSRLRTLSAAQQTVVMTIAGIDNFRTACATNIDAIDKLLNVTIPNWELVESHR